MRELAAGLTFELKREVRPEMSARHLGSGTLGVLSTPSMIAMMERNAAMLAREHLGSGKATVGFSICVKHVASAREGATCSVSADLREVVDGRKLHFEVEVREGQRTIGLGTH